MRRIALLVAGAALLTGCGAGETSGTASVWVTRDRGAKVLLIDAVPAGLTAMQALRRVAKVKTRYGGRFVQAINDLEGSLSAHRDWFYFVNGYEGDRSAAEYRLHAGDVEWWDYRSWARKDDRVPVVVGAFPEPFLHGYGGKTRPAAIVGVPTPEAKALARRLRLQSVRTSVVEAPPGANVLVLAGPGPTRFVATGGTSPGDPVVFTFAGDSRALLRGDFRFRYEVGS